MLLCDIGNTSYHFLNNDESYKESVGSFDPSVIKEKVYYISVNPKLRDTLESLENWIDISVYIDMNLYYPTMGIDRVFACEAINDGVIVDAGSAITVDLVIDDTYQGGFIYPGTNAMQQTYTNISTALDYEFNYKLQTNKLAKNSQDSISYGYLAPFYKEVISYNQNIILTGGDAQKLLELFPMATIKEYLIFDGMKKILQKNGLV